MMTGIELLIDKIIPGNCIEVLNTLPLGSVDMIFADPPYNLQLQNELFRPNRTRVNGVDDPWDQFNSFEDYDRFTRLWLGACQRVLKETGTIWVIGTYHCIYRVGAILQDLGYWILNDIIWVKTNPMPNFKGVRFTNAQETLVWAQKRRGGRYTFNHHAIKALNGDLQMRSDWHLPLCTGKERIKVNGGKAHTTQKPEALLYRVILSSTNPGDIILDPFFGTGTTGAVAKKLKRHWIGIEEHQSYVEIAQARIDSIQMPEGENIDSVYEIKPRQPRIPFGVLVERSLLMPGQTLYFDQREDACAVILSDGHIRFQDVTGSIHQVARNILNAPCNGWQHWYYRDISSGKMVVIDQLRQRLMDTENLADIHEGKD
jgi:modification methylase